MTKPSSTPRGEHAPAPGVTWNTTITTTGEVIVPDGPWGGPAKLTLWSSDGPTAPAKPNRETRRAITRAARRKK
ncbi:hypothetical protein [Streptomyces sp. NPDC001221]